MDYYENIRKYYKQSNWLYKHVWYAGKSKGLHFGFTDSETKDHTQALINQYKYVIKKGHIKDGMKILDAGCGVGGAAVYIAKETRAEVVGITLVPEQAVEALEYANKQNVDNLVKFVVGDYLQTGLKSKQFDVIIGIESICYATPKCSFVKEVYRLLKPGGRLVLTDGYRRRELRGKQEEKIMREFCEGWALYGLVSYTEMAREMSKGGFERVKVEDMTEATTMSLNKMRSLVKWWRLGEIVLGWIDLPIVKMARANALAMSAWIKGIDTGLFGYFAHVASKPKK